jgi:hypothetical protein
VDQGKTQFFQTEEEPENMRKMSFGIACVAVLVAVSMASAGTINLWTATACPGQTPGFNATPGNATTWVAPTDQNATLATRYGVTAAALGYDTGSVYIMGDVGCRGDGNGHETIASLGLNIRKSGSGPDSGALSATGFTVFTSGTGAASGPWSPPSPNTPTLNAGGGLLVQNSRAVAVPASTGDALWHGYTVNTGSGAVSCGTGGVFNVGGVNGHYRMARLDVAANTTGVTAGHAPTSFNLFMQVGALKIARVYDPTATNGGAPENVSFGYNGAVPDGTVSGSTVGAESANPDAVVVIRRKGDYGSVDVNGNAVPIPDGAVGGADIGFFLAAQGSSGNNLNTYLGDFGSVDANGNAVPVRDCAVGGADIGFFLNAQGS